MSLIKFLLNLVPKSSRGKNAGVEYQLANEPSATSRGGLHEAQVKEIIDGDTVDLVLSDREVVRVRLECIDSPEGDQPWGDNSKSALKSLIGVGQHVYLEIHGLDRYKRVLATIYVMIDSELVNVNERMVMLGHAWSTSHIYQHLSPNRRRQLVMLERWARSKKVGLWKTSSPMAPWEWRSRAKEDEGHSKLSAEPFGIAEEEVSIENVSSGEELGDSITYVVRKNKFTNKMFLEFDDETLISPEGRDIELDEERFCEPEEADESQLTERQLTVYRNKIKAVEARAMESSQREILQKKLFKELRKARMRIAAAKRIPAYVVFEDRTLIEMSEVMPESESMMLQIWGIGPEKLRMYGSYFLKVVKKFKNDMVPASDNKRDTG